MKKNSKLLKFVILTSIITIGLYSTSILISQLGERYFLLHEQSLTIETYTYDETSTGVNYTYLPTPFDLPAQMFIIMSFLLPPFVVWIFGYLYIRDKSTLNDLAKSLTLPATYGLINIIFFFSMMDPATGWEYELGMMFLFVEIFAIIVISLVINLLAIVFKKTQALKRDRKP